MENWDMLGHEWAVQLLKEHISRDRLRHAYLLTGPQGVGRRTLALRFAQAVNCPNPLAPGEPCRVCRTCQHIEQMQHPDLAVVQAEGRFGVLKVDQIRELQHQLALTPYEARYRIALLLRFEQANPSAANALLKTLEEPSSQVILILTAGSIESLLPTIVSRCEVLRLRPMAADQLARGLQHSWGLAVREADELANISGGRAGYAIHLSESPDQRDLRSGWLKNHTELLSASRVERFRYAEALSKDKERLWDILPVWLLVWRDVLLCSSGASVELTNPDYRLQIEQLAQKIDLHHARHTVSSLEHILEMLETNVNTRLAVEILMLDLPHLSISG